MRLDVLLVLSIPLLVAVGCGREEQTYKGQPISYWLKLSDDADVNTRERAVREMASYGGRSVREFQQRLGEVLRDKRQILSLRVAAASGLQLSDEQREQLRYEFVRKLSDAADLYPDPASSPQICVEVAPLLTPKQAGEVRDALRPRLSQPQLSAMRREIERAIDALDARAKS